MTTVALGDVADINPRGDRPSVHEEVSFVGMADLSAEIGVAGPGTVRPFEDVSKGYTIFRDQDLLVAKITPCFENGKIGQAQLSRPIGVGSTEFHVVRPNADRLDPRYALHFLRQAWIRQAGELRMTGSGGQRRVPAGFVSGLEVPLPPIEEQRRIAAILDHAQALMSRSARRLNHLDELLDARFRVDFGDLGPKSPGALPLKTFVPQIENGRSPVCESRPRSGAEYGVLKLGAVTYGTYRPDENKAYLGEIRSTDRPVRAGDLLMTRKNTKDLVGAVAHVTDTPDRLLLPDLVFRLNYDSDLVHPVFIQRLLMTGSMRDAVRGLASGSAASMPNISKARLLALPVPMPSMKRQEAFVAAAMTVAAVREEAELSQRSLGRLTASLQTRAFSGRL